MLFWRTCMNDERILNELINRYPELEVCKKDIWDAFNAILDCYGSNHKLLVAGNGGSCSDAEHIVGELMKTFKSPRKLPNTIKKQLLDIDKDNGLVLSESIRQPFAAIALGSHTSFNTAMLNDMPDGGTFAFAQELYGLGQKGDVFFAISTSGNSKNLVYASVIAKLNGLKVISLLGKTGGILKEKSDVAIVVPRNETYLIQELHLPIYHCICLMIEEHFFPSNNNRGL